jgi:hypothetical protein
MAVKAAVVGFTEKYVAQPAQNSDEQAPATESTKVEFDEEKLDELEGVDLVNLVMSGEPLGDSESEDEDSLRKLILCSFFVKTRLNLSELACQFIAWTNTSQIPSMNLTRVSETSSSPTSSSSDWWVETRRPPPVGSRLPVSRGRCEKKTGST